MDSLKSVIMILAAPVWGDGKNDDSNLDLEVSITTNNKQLFVSTLPLRENSEVKKGFWIPALMKLPDNHELISYENIESIDSTVNYWKPNFNSGNDYPPIGDINKNTDKWNIRIEVVLTFESDKVLSTNGSDPALELNFAKERQNVKPFGTLITREMMIDHQVFNDGIQGSVG